MRLTIPCRAAIHANSYGDTARVLRRTIIIGLTAFLTVVDLFATQAILPSLAQAYWVSPAAMRHVLPEVQKPEGGSIKADVSVPVASVPQFLEEASAAAKAIIAGCRPVPFGHLGDGNVHFNVSQPVGADTAQFLARWGEVNDAVNKIVLKYNGSISAEHGIGKLKRDSLPKVKDPVALELMRGLKRMLDPNGILNPGKVL